ncbi:MAG: hypothetical protein ACREBG_30890 [Pyrinomonadaceae bacterium]
MNRRSQILKLGQRPLWKRILERHKFRGRLLRARVPLVLLRLWSPIDSRQARIPPRPDVSPYLLSLHIELSWPQWLVNAYGPRIRLEKSTFNSSVIKELKWLCRNPRSTNTSSTLRSNPIGRRPSSEAGRNQGRIAPGRQGRGRGHSASELAAGGRWDSPANLRTLAPVLADRSLPPDRSTRIPATLRPFTETFAKNRLHTAFVDRDVFAPAVFRIAKPMQGVERISVGGSLLPPAFDAAATQQVISRRNGVARALNRNVETTAQARSSVQSRFGHRARTDADVEVMPRASAPVQSRFVHRARTDADGRDSLDSGRSRLYAQSAWLNFANNPASSSTERIQPPEQATPTRPPASVQPVQPQLDIGRLSEEVYRHIQRKIRVERERRGQ